MTVTLHQFPVPAPDMLLVERYGREMVRDNPGSCLASRPTATPVWKPSSLTTRCTCETASARMVGRPCSPHEEWVVFVAGVKDGDYDI